MRTMKLWKDGSAIEVDRRRLVLTDRSRVVQRKNCEMKRWVEYSALGQGMALSRKPEDLALGTAVHAGLEHAMAGVMSQEEIEVVAWTASRVARKNFAEAAEQGLVLQDQEEFARLMPEVAGRLIGEQKALAEALVFAWAVRELPSVLKRWEPVAVEMEVPWLLGEVNRNEGKVQVGVMSRLDLVLKERGTGTLWPVSYKTTKRFDTNDVRELETDPQSFAEGLAVLNQWGQAPHSTLYWYLVKGDKSWDDDVMAKRYTSGLIRPYTTWDGTGEPLPDQFSPVWKWQEDGKERRLGKGWRKVDVWTEFELETWLGWLADGLVRPELGRDWLGEAMAGPIEMPWNRESAERWARQTAWAEAEYEANALMVGAEGIEPSDLFELNEGNCWKYGKRCHAYALCWEGSTLTQEIGKGRYVARVPNHPVEVEHSEFLRGEENGKLQF